MYLPPSVILPEVFYTGGGEYYYATNYIDYVGYYHKDKYGNAYSGKTHTEESQKLNPAFGGKQTPPDLGSTVNASIYSNLDNNINQHTGLSLPTNDSLPPTAGDYEKTYYTRYILEYKLSSQPYFIETSKSTYFSYVNGFDSKYFNNVEVLWKITGPLYDQKENGILMVGGVFDSNLKSINQARKTINGIEKYLTDPLLYYKP